jgi:hypothetical protein
MNQNQGRIILFASIGGVLLLLLAGIFFVRLTTFSLISSDPSNGDTNVYLGTNLKFTFSKPLNSSTAERITFSPALKGIADVNGAVLTYKPTVSLDANTQYQVTISQPLDDTGESAKDVHITFKTGGTYFSDLPKSQQQAEKNGTDSIQRDAPLTQYLPKKELDYTVNYKIEDNGSVTYQVALNVTPRYAGDPTYIPALKNAQTEALAWIKSVGFDPATLHIVYNPDPTTGVFTP